jgi:hypothetical protein
MFIDCAEGAEKDDVGTNADQNIANAKPRGPVVSPDEILTMLLAVCHLIS